MSDEIKACNSTARLENGPLQYLSSMTAEHRHEEPGRPTHFFGTGVAAYGRWPSASGTLTGREEGPPNDKGAGIADPFRIRSPLEGDSSEPAWRA